MHACRRLRGMRLAVFDMGGTVINEGGLVYKTLYETLLSFGLNVTPHNIEQWHGANKYEVLDHFLKLESNSTEFLERQHILRQKFDDNLKQQYFSKKSVKLIDPSVPELFDKIRYNGTKIALNTGYSKEIQSAIINNLHLNNIIDDKIASNEVRRGRPYPDMINKLMIRHDIYDPKRVAKIGDTQNDIYEGKHAGCAKLIGVLTGAGTRDSLNKAGATEILNSIIDLK